MKAGFNAETTTSVKFVLKVVDLKHVFVQTAHFAQTATT